MKKELRCIKKLKKEALKQRFISAGQMNFNDLLIFLNLIFKKHCNHVDVMFRLPT
jgi:hypothetical protein